MQRVYKKRGLPARCCNPPIFLGAPGEIRTPGLRIRSPTLYPAELRAHAICLCGLFQSVKNRSRNRSWNQLFLAVLDVLDRLEQNKPATLWQVVRKEQICSAEFDKDVTGLHGRAQSMTAGMYSTKVTTQHSQFSAGLSRFGPAGAPSRAAPTLPGLDRSNANRCKAKQVRGRFSQTADRTKTRQPGLEVNQT